MRHSFTAAGAVPVSTRHLWACRTHWYLRDKLLLEFGGEKTFSGRSHTIKLGNSRKHLEKHLGKFQLIIVGATRKPSKTKWDLELGIHATIDDQRHGIGGFRAQSKLRRDPVGRNLPKTLTNFRPFWTRFHGDPKLHENSTKSYGTLTRSFADYTESEIENRTQIAWVEVEKSSKNFSAFFGLQTLKILQNLKYSSDRVENWYTSHFWDGKLEIEVRLRIRARWKRLLIFQSLGKLWGKKLANSGGHQIQTWNLRVSTSTILTTRPNCWKLLTRKVSRGVTPSCRKSWPETLGFLTNSWILATSNLGQLLEKSSVRVRWGLVGTVLTCSYRFWSSWLMPGSLEDSVVNNRVRCKFPI